jgi:hypothetical protein
MSRNFVAKDYASMKTRFSTVCQAKMSQRFVPLLRVHSWFDSSLLAGDGLFFMPKVALSSNRRLLN